MRCSDCPDLPNGTRKRPFCCKRAGALKVGDVVPLPVPKPDIRPAFTGPGRPSFKAARNGKR